MLNRQILTTNRRALAILFSTRLSMASLKSLKKALSCASSSRVGAPVSYGNDQSDVEYITGGSELDIRGLMFQISVPCTLISSSGRTWSALLRIIRVCKCGMVSWIWNVGWSVWIGGRWVLLSIRGQKIQLVTKKFGLVTRFMFCIWWGLDFGILDSSPNSKQNIWLWSLMVHSLVYWLSCKCVLCAMSRAGNPHSFH
jgi:hypothetical protein